jgi:hypothetical protein
MTSYRTVWVRSWAAVVLLCIGFAGVIWGPARVVAFFAVVGVTSLAPSICYYRERVARQGSPLDLWRATARTAVITGAVAVAIIAVIGVNGALAMLVLLLAGATSPWALDRLRKVLHRGRPAREATGLPAPLVEAAVAEPRIETMSDLELCRAWRASFAALVAAVEPEAKSDVVRLRQSYLDELERRHPHAVGAWLASHPRPGGGPEKFLARRDDGRSAA